MLLFTEYYLIGYCTLIVVFTMVTEATREIALPFRMDCGPTTDAPGLEIVTPELAIMVPTITPPPA
jgi:hypothetical protein